MKLIKIRSCALLHTGVSYKRYFKLNTKTEKLFKQLLFIFSALFYLETYSIYFNQRVAKVYEYKRFKKLWILATYYHAYV